MPVPTSPLVKVMIDAARKAGRGLARDFGEVLSFRSRARARQTTSAPPISRPNRRCSRCCSKARPGYSFLGEERE